MKYLPRKSHLLLWSVFHALLFVTGISQAAPSRPNIIFFYADDMGYGDLACYGSEVAQTPRIDQLAAEGTRFTQFYVSNCVCSPTRASAITGQFPSRHQICGYVSFFEQNEKRHMPNWLDVEAASFPRVLQQAGYRTGLIGKWHLGGGSGSTFRITDLKKPDVDTSGRTEIVVNHPDAPPVVDYGFHHARISAGNGLTWKKAKPWPEPHDKYPYVETEWLTWSSRAIADDSIQFLDDHVASHKEDPFYLNVWFKDVHTPFKPTDEMLAPFTELDEKARDHYAMLKYMDGQIGRVLDRLDDLGMSKNTLVIFSSDNGAGRRRGGSNGHFRGWKHMLYEGGIRVPLIMRWPAGAVQAGRVDETSVVNICDFVPTFSELTGVKMPEGYESDGESFSTAMKGKTFERTKAQYWYYPSAKVKLAMRSGDWKLLANPNGDSVELYDLASDPEESSNLTGENPEVTARLKHSLLDWYAQTPVGRKAVMN
ncbi:sulfatase-like hydrolase/transferase [Verrucomicrobiales bacterium]|nr:sulfatase-like hydrolase/transferase [Verrucomicrobiales bacterium]